jgi:hypothetical protein
MVQYACYVDTPGRDAVGAIRMLCRHPREGCCWFNSHAMLPSSQQQAWKTSACIKRDILSNKTSTVPPVASSQRTGC